ncbi:MAG TPA: plastocyanin/azurin family copper-binding protein [Dongiaceae bacterium]|jgi:plastocyanin|nr:plastocyanin/azurin family copper-binding protein [Dongiaceae bacterium]
MNSARAIKSLFLLTSVAALAGCGLSGPAHDEPMANAAAVVDMGFASFDPEVVHIHAGQQVEWRNTALITHTVTDDKSVAADPNDASIPAGATAFNSGDLPAGQVYSQTFTVPGTYKYFCERHEGHGMFGTVVVDPAP